MNSQQIKCIFICGDDYSINQSLLKVKTNIFGSSNHRDDIIRPIEPNHQQVVSYLLSQSLFGQGQILVILDCQSVDTSVVEAIGKVADSIPEGSYVVFIDSNGSYGTVLRNKIKKLCKKNGVIMDTKPLLNNNEAILFAKKVSSEIGLTITDENIRFLIEYIGIERNFINKELEKLKILNYSNITHDTIISNVIPNGINGDFLLLYKSLEDGNIERVLNCIDFMYSTGMDASVIATVIFNMCNTMSTLKAVKQNDISLVIWGKVNSKEIKAPSAFVKRIASRVNKRISVNGYTMFDMFIEAYDTIVRSRVDKNYDSINKIKNIFRIMCGE